MANRKQKPASQGFAAPEILVEPQGRLAILGTKLALFMKADGFPAPTYQWFHNGRAVSGAVTPWLTFEKVRRLHEGTYHCEVRNFMGKAASRPCALHVVREAPPPLVIGPIHLHIQAGKALVLRVEAPREALRGVPVQWARNGERIEGAHGPELRIPAALPEHSGHYKAMIAIGVGLSVSNAAHVLVAAAEGETELPPFENLPESPSELPEPVHEESSLNWNNPLYAPPELASEPVAEAPSELVFDPAEAPTLNWAGEPDPAAQNESYLSDLNTDLLVNELEKFPMPEEPPAAPEVSQLPIDEAEALLVPEQREEISAQEHADESELLPSKEPGATPAGAAGLGRKKAFLKNLLARCQNRSPRAGSSNAA